jgi:hypothetical protein
VAAYFLFLLVVAATYTGWSSGGALARVGDCSWLAPMIGYVACNPCRAKASLHFVVCHSNQIALVILYLNS